MSREWNETKKRVDEKVDSIVNKIEKEDLEEIRERLYKMIEYAIGRFDYYENMREKILRVGLSYIAFFAGAGVLLYRIRNEIPSISVKVGSFSIGVVFLTGIVIIAKYWHVAAGRYPYRKFSDIRSWYFIYSLPKDLPLQMSIFDKKKEKQIKNTAESYVNTVDKWVEYANKERGFLKEDLQQVFILHYLQKTRRDSLNNMKSALVFGTSLFVLSILCFFASFFGSVYLTVSVIVSIILEIVIIFFY